MSTNENTNSETTTATRLRLLLPTITNQLERCERGINQSKRGGSCGFDDCKIIKLIKLVNNNNKGRPGFSRMQFMKALLLITLSMVLVADLSRFLRLQMAPSRTLDQLGAGSSLTSPAWASWIGEVPTAAEMYGEGSADMPTTEAFDDDEEEPDDELDASASNEYPENENDNENDESYEDQDENPDGAESRRKERWLPAASGAPVSQQQRPQTWLRHNERRNKRDLEDRMVLASRRAERKNRKRDKNAPSDEDEFNVEDGDEDAWVHDGVDDIHIDPETKKAASELSYDERSIDAEYEPSENQKEPPVLNRTRVTTITDVIPITDDTDGNAGERDSTKVDWRFLPPPPPTRAAMEVPTSAAAAYLPASYLTIDQAQRLIGQQHERLERQERLLQNQERQLAALSSEPSATWTATASAPIEPPGQLDRRRQLSGV